jgi:hypothetical protein
MLQLPVATSTLFAKFKLRHYPMPKSALEKELGNTRGRFGNSVRNQRTPARPQNRLDFPPRLSEPSETRAVSGPYRNPPKPSPSCATSVNAAWFQRVGHDHGTAGSRTMGG